jgi:hypothetical protein
VRLKYRQSDVSPAAIVRVKLQKLELVLSWITLHFVGWVEPTPSSFGFRCTQPNLHVDGAITNIETQQLPISELAVFLASCWAFMKLN